MKEEPGKVSLVTDLDEIAQELLPRTMWMVRPQLNRKYPSQRMPMTVEVVDLNTLNLATLPALEML